MKNLLSERDGDQWAEKAGGKVPKELDTTDYPGNHTERGRQLHGADVRAKELRGGQLEKIQRSSHGDGGQNGNRKG